MNKKILKFLMDIYQGIAKEIRKVYPDTTSEEIFELSNTSDTTLTKILDDHPTIFLCMDKYGVDWIDDAAEKDEAETSDKYESEAIAYLKELKKTLKDKMYVFSISAMKAAFPIINQNPWEYLTKLITASMLFMQYPDKKKELFCLFLDCKDEDELEDKIKEL